VDRKLIEKGAEELGIPLKEHIEIVLKAMQSISEKLGL
jgi:predicted hydrolase (HD superfamily)